LAYAYTSGDQGLIATGAYSCAYAELEAWQKAEIDGTWTTGTPAGIVGATITSIGELAELMLGTPGLPAEWGLWLIDEVVAKIAALRRMNGYRELRDMADESRDRALRSISRRDMDDDTVADDLNVQSLIWLIVPGLASAGIFVTRDEMDHAIITTINDLWNRRDWVFRSFQAVGTINTSSVVAITSPASLSWDGVSTQKLYLQGALNGAPRLVKYATREDMARLASEADVAAQPRYFFTEWSSSNPDTMAWQFYPAPDQTYTFNAAMQRTSPGAPTSLTSTTAFDRFPDEFRALIQMGVQAQIKRLKSVRGWESDQSEYERMVDTMGIHISAQGAPITDDLAVRDVYGDQNDFLGGFAGYGGAM